MTGAAEGTMTCGFESKSRRTGVHATAVAVADTDASAFLIDYVERGEHTRDGVTY